MGARRVSSAGNHESNRPPARTPEEREQQLILAAENLAERQLLSGEASAQVITHYLKLGSTRERLEQQRLKNEVALLDQKRLHLESEMRTETLIQDALQAMRQYTGADQAELEASHEDYED